MLRKDINIYGISYICIIVFEHSLREIMSARQFILSICFIVHSICSYAVTGRSETVFENLTVSDGLPHNTVQKIFQDSEGYIWMATKDGLCRYDGSNYVTFRESISHKSLSNSKVRCIAEDGERNIWAGTDNGLNRISIIDGTIDSYFSESDTLLKSDRINDLYYDRVHNRLWIATDKGVSIYDISGRAFSDTGQEEAFNQETNTIWGCEDTGFIYIGTHNGLFRYSGSPHSVTRVTYPGENYANIFSLYGDMEGNVYFGSSASMLAVIRRGRDTADVLLPRIYGTDDDSDVYGITETGDRMWLTTKRNGIYFYDPISEKLSGPVVPDNAGDEDRIMLTGCYRDNDSSIWIGSYYKGIFFHSRFINRFKHIPLRISSGKSSGIIGNIVQDNYGLWLGSDGTGITLYSPEDGQLSHYELADGDIPAAECKPMFEDNGILWTGTESQGIFLFDTSTRKIIAHYTSTSPDRKIPGNRINHIYRDSKGNIWAGINGGEGGIILYDRASRTFRNLRPGNDNGNVKDVYYIYETGEGSLWLGTRNNGIFCYDTEKNTFTPVPILGREDLSISCILKDSRQRIWAGSFGQGLVCFDNSGNVTKVFDLGDDNGRNNICSILEDNDGHIWISSFYSIACYDEEEGRFIQYDKGNGFPLSHVKPMSAHKTENGSLYYGGGNGLVELYPEELLSENSVIPIPVLTDVMVNNMDIGQDLHSILMKERHLRLEHDQNNLSIMFTAMGYIYPERNQCRYMLLGADDEWNTALPGQRQVNYSNLNPGRYSFLLSASNGNGIWSEPETLFSVRIRPAPWLTWWAYSLYALVILSLAALFLYYQRTKIQLEHNLEIKDIEESNLNRMHQFRMDLFTNFSHEVRTPLTLVSGSVDDLIDSSDAKDRNILIGIQRNVSRIMDLVNQLMDFRKQDCGRMELDASEVDLVPFINDVAVTFGELSRIQNRRLVIDMPYDSLVLWFNPKLMEKVFYNVLMNAFKYSDNESDILLKVEKTDLEGSLYREKADMKVTGAVLVSVYNRGDRIPDDKLEEIFEPFFRLRTSLNQAGTGIGLSFNRMIMHLHHSEIWAENTGDGVVFRFMIPEGKDHLEDNEISIHNDDNRRLSDLTAVRSPEYDSPVEQNMNGNFRTLLLAEDNDEIRKYLKDKLSSTYNVIECNNGAEALKILSKIDTDLVISDIMMPEMDGIELCRSIKEDSGLNHIPVILLTAYASDMNVKAGLSAGADDYVTKPFKFEILSARIKNLLDNNDRMRQAFQKRVNPDDMNVEVRDYDESFLQKCYDYLQKNLNNPDLTVEDFGKELGMSRVQLYRKIKYLTNLSPSRFIMSIRMKIAGELLRQTKAPVSDICYQVGFNSLSYFAKTFKDTYGLSPTEYRETHTMYHNKQSL